MALDTEFLKGIFANEETSLDDKIKSILSEHEADTRGLVQKKDELLGSERKLKDQIKDFTERDKTNSEKIAGLEEELKKNSPEEHKKYYDAQLEQRQKAFDEELAKVTAERDTYRKSHLQRLQADAVEEGIKDLVFVDGLKNGYVACVLTQNQFEPKDIDGKTVFLNSANKSIQDALHEFSLTAEGKSYLKNPNTGGGGRGSSGTGKGGKALTREQFEALSPAQRSAFFKDGGKLI